MTLEVSQKQRYPVAVGHQLLPARIRSAAGASSAATRSPPTPTPRRSRPRRGASSFRFRVQRPGRYLALCNTPLDPDNFISKEFRVK